MKIKEPETEEELEEYYDLRWRVLRKPWNKPKGSEKDEIENKSHHIIAKTGEEKIIGVGRGHFNTPKEAQIRFMAVRKEYREEGMGSSILEKLEKILKEKGAEYIVLNARGVLSGFTENMAIELLKKSTNSLVKFNIIG